MSELDGKVALVTGGSRGIGAAIAARLAREGAHVAITYESAAERAAGVVGEIEGLGRKALAVQADSADAAAVTAAVDTTAATFGGLDILVNNAGIFPALPIDDLTPELIDRTLAIHVGSVLVAAKAAVRHMTAGAQPDGRIISIGSDLADRAAFPGLSLYSASKSALTGLSKGLARDLGPRGITANVVHPGSTDTEMNPADGPTAPSQLADIPLGRFAQPADIAAAVAYLAGPGARYVTGTSITVDGGFTA
ncbi:NAD(P)-dependent dehydrogenase, short-chain alcohol dehydrogenase family [Amycolatopsis marina]|uniref:NAD(P)-dependent dehydrogenase, short-chain alcohol dehydrogenase family n=1 Tax=Amycolatopsis marina TaxID=490629 RepID=A0A1I1A1Z0_9PSEU|nr:SDR family oxidoreductase [Amycolatopsis marina]SFB31961.1 NAD(P)-dependent dehydrogenase, short-chain alcohol dehydrogenase family [Amycolatopsis marina]